MSVQAGVDESGEVFQLAELPSRCPNPRNGAAQRADPYSRDLWSGGSQANWRSREVADMLVEAGEAELYRAEQRVDPDGPFEEIFTPRLRVRRLAALAAVTQWRTLTEEQVATITGQRSDFRRWNDLTVLWAAGLIDRGLLSTHHRSEKPPVLYRILTTGRLGELLDSLPYQEWLATTAGLAPTMGPRHDRHNVLAAELALRFAEFTDIAAVFGEQLSRHGTVVHRPPRSFDDKQRQAAGDGVAVRDDGLRLVIELTAHTFKSTENKILRWCEAFSESDFDDEGAIVVFVEAAGRHDSGYEFSRLRETLARTVLRFPNAARRRLDERFAVARWRTWFPGRHLADRSFLTATVERPTGPIEERWEPVDLLGPSRVPFNPPDPEWFLSAIANQHLLYGVPHWMRDPNSPVHQHLEAWMNDQARDVDAPLGRLPDLGS